MRQQKEIRHKGHLGPKDFNKSGKLEGKNFGSNSGINGNIGQGEGNYNQGIVVSQNNSPNTLGKGS